MMIRYSIGMRNGWKREEINLKLHGEITNSWNTMIFNKDVYNLFKI